jgi:Arc/MetJ-type ribon-helix-helix transcriptional regulator
MRAVALDGDAHGPHDAVMSQPKRATTFSVTIPPEMAEAVFQQVKQGHHGSAGAVIRAALRQMLQLGEDGAPLDAPPPPDDAPKWKQRGGSRMRSD